MDELSELEDLAYLFELSEVLRMKKAYIILDKDGIVFATHSWGGDNPPEECPVAAPPGGSTVAMEQGEANTLIGLARGGQKLSVVNEEIRVDGTPIGSIVDGKIVLSQ